MWKYTAVVLAAIVVVRGPQQPCSLQFAQMIVQGCGYDQNKQVLCTTRGCFALPRIDSAGPLMTTLTGNQYPSYIVLSHQTGWIQRAIVNVTTSKEIVCVLANIKTPPS